MDMDQETEIKRGCQQRLAFVTGRKELPKQSASNLVTG